ncbi:hypothetical protein [Solimonas terrae]|uniref:Uncharacterized protein n=1 Tax=Solimonas terrae TaxID=1396819 RepID=A0A6M2BQ88_9GAMM|nr:hypothetical protein [Solimonas terrae]NGY04460.1 hypothetical protein [Solimonas terrae]
MNRTASAIALTTTASAALLLGACQSWTQKSPAQAVAETAPPAADEACHATLKMPAPILKLPGTDAPRHASNDNDVDIAQIHTVNQPLQQIGVWNDQGDGWSVLALTLGSRRARSIAVRMRDVKLPKQSALWLCSPDGKLRQGPYTEAPNGELWSASIASSQARVEVWLPTPSRDAFSAELTDVYGGYQP